MDFNVQVGILCDQFNPQSDAFAQLHRQGFSFVTIPLTAVSNPGFSSFPPSSYCVNHLDQSCTSTGSPPTSLGNSLDSGISEAVGKSSDSWHSTVLLPYTPGETYGPAAAGIRFSRNTRELDSGKWTQPRAWFHIPMYGSQAKSNATNSCSTYSSKEAIDAYFYWHDILCKTRCRKRLFIALELDHRTDAQIAERWLVESIGCLIIPISLFSCNPSPSLNLFHRAFLQKCIQLNGCSVMLKLDIPDLPENFLKTCVKYLKDFSGFMPHPLDLQEVLLHKTMQPLHRNLCDEDYSGFELDRVKYDLYQDAIQLAMRHLRAKRFSRYDEKGLRRAPNGQSEKFTVAVLGCGRGPLVTSVLRAAASIYSPVKVYALDKNPETRAILKQKQLEDWKDKEVDLVFGDMRTWKPARPLDVIVSELIGNFGDDECSPECLAGPEQILKVDGISIPQSYTNFLMPVSATRLYQEVRGHALERRQEMRAFSRRARFEYFPLAPPLALFTFSHSPRLDGSVKSNFRHVTLNYVSTTNGMLHGFNGYFTVHLFESRTLSTLQETITPGLASWDAVFFPLMEPVCVLQGETISLEFKRRCDSLRVWYEYRLLLPEKSLMHNLGGENQSFRLDFESDSTGQNDPVG